MSDMSILSDLTEKVEDLTDKISIKESELEAKDNVPSEQTLDSINQDVREGAPDNFDPEEK